MIALLTQGHYELFVLLLFAIVFSLSFHEFGHAYVAKTQGDLTAAQEGRLTINPWAHIDPFGLLMVVFVGFGYAKPVPTDPRNYTSRYSTMWVAAAGPFMNLILAALSINLLVLLLQSGNLSGGMHQFLQILASINMLLMLFNMIPIGPLDGHYILPYFLPRGVARRYVELNARYGAFVLLGLIVLAILGLPIFSSLMAFANLLLGFLVVV